MVYEVQPKPDIEALGDLSLHDLGTRIHNLLESPAEVRKLLWYLFTLDLVASLNAMIEGFNHDAAESKKTIVNCVKQRLIETRFGVVRPTWQVLRHT